MSLSTVDRAALHALFDEAMARFGRSATVLVMIAGFHLEWDHNVYLALKHCNSAMALEPSADEVFRVRVIRGAALAHEARVVAGAAAANMQLEARKHTTAAEASMLVLLRSKARLFSCLRGSVVNLADVLAASRDVMGSYTSAVEHYKAALALLPSSIGTMRAYAGVLNAVYDRSAAATLLTAADALEEARSKQSSRVYRRITWEVVSSFDVSLETNAVIQVSIDSRSMGAVVMANAEACRLFGYSQQVRLLLCVRAVIFCVARVSMYVCMHERVCSLSVVPRAGVHAVQHQLHCPRAYCVVPRRFDASVCSDRQWHDNQRAADSVWNKALWGCLSCCALPAWRR